MHSSTSWAVPPADTMQFSYVQIGARDYESLAAFYKKALEFKKCEDLSWLRGKEGTTLSAPGFEGKQAPVFGFVKAEKGAARKINDCGFAHICFETENVRAAVKRFVECGGSFVSTLKLPKMNPCVYCKDPEGNIVEFHIPFPAEKTAGQYLNTAGCLLQMKKYAGLRFIHVNIITQDWEELCEFYRGAFGCTDTGNLKDHQGGYKSKVIGIEDVHVVGRHILLPGFYATYPTLEMFSYSVPGLDRPAEEDELGLSGIGFLSENPAADSDTVCACGGTCIETTENFAHLLDSQQGHVILKQFTD